MDDVENAVVSGAGAVDVRAVAAPVPAAADAPASTAAGTASAAGEDVRQQDQSSTAGTANKDNGRR